jgi:hypothetical protein
MSRNQYLEGAFLVKGEKTDWSPTAKLILAFIISLLLLSPAILGIYWEKLLPK